MADYLTFTNILNAVQKASRDNRASKQDYHKNTINMVYLSEILAVDDLHPLHWLIDFDDSLSSVAPATITDITAADPGVFTTDAAHGHVAGNIVGLYDIVGTTELNNRIFKINSAPSTTTFTLIDINSLDAIDTSALTAYTSGGAVLHRGLTLATTGKDVDRVLRCKWHGYNKSLIKIGLDELESNTALMGSSSARPTRYLHKKSYIEAGTESNQLFWYPGADAAYDFRYWLQKRTPRLIEGSDVPMLPKQFHYSLISGTMTRVVSSGVETENPPIWPQVYQAELAGILTYNQRYWAKIEQEQQSFPYLI